jgi:hypothetical protein
MWIDGCPREVLLECRKLVHGFRRLLTHPLMGDLCLLRNPYRTVLVGEKGEGIDVTSLIYLEEGLARLHSLPREDLRREHLEDYQSVDLDLIQTAIERIGFQSTKQLL